MPFLRSVFIALSHSPVARALVTQMPGVRGATRRFVAGETLAEALAAIRALNEAGCLASLDSLGENTTTEAGAREAAAEVQRCLEGIARGGLKANVSIKLTQMGLDLGDPLCEEIVAGLLKGGNFVRIDMEGSAYTERTVRLFGRLRERLDNVGLVLQAYLRRTERDVRWIASQGFNVRLCKGAYLEPPELAFPDMADVDRSYLECAGILLAPESLSKGTRPCFATHDPAMVDGVKVLVARQGVPRDRFEFQMLYGIRRDLQQSLVKEGFTVRVYVPYGPEWYPYFMRRLAERPENVGFIVRNVFRG